MQKKENFFSKLFSRLKGAESDTKKITEPESFYELLVIEGEEAGKTFELGRKPIFIGRKMPGDERRNDILIKDEEGTLSPKQIRITWDIDKNIHMIEPLMGTSKPTMVNGIIIKNPTCLQEGSQILMGKNFLIYQRKGADSLPTVHREIQKIPDYSVPQEEEYIFKEEEECKTGYGLKVISGLEEGKEFELNRHFMSIGKLTAIQRDGWILLDTSSISTEQATLEWMDKHKKFGIFHIKNSKTPTYVNNREVSDKNFTLLKEGDVIRTGKIMMEVKYKAGRQSESRYINKEGELKTPFEEHKAGLRKKEIEPPEEKPSYDYEKYEDAPTTKNETLDLSFKEAHLFHVISGPDKERTFTISKGMVENKLIIGRKGGARKDIELSDDAISDCYASLTFDDNWVFINLEDERGNVLVNGLSVIKKGLEDDDVIKLGNTTLEYCLMGTAVSSRKGATLEIIEGFEKDKLFPLKRKLICIGRKSEESKQKEIELPEDDRSVSRQHACIEKKNNRFYLVNQKPTNLTLLNGVQVTEPRPLVNGDKIKVGNETLFLYSYLEAPVVIREKQKEINVLSQKEINVLSQKEINVLSQKEPNIDGQKKFKVVGQKKFKVVEHKNVPEKKEINEKQSDTGSLQPVDEDMIFIPGGAFWMGINNMEGDAGPRHKVFVDAFYIDKYAVTNLQYADFVKTTGYKSKGNWQEYFTDGKEYYPVVAVTYNDAQTYASWKGKRLPSEAEWEKAARGEKGKLYPWGYVWDPSLLCSKDGGPLAPVDSYTDGSSPYGVMNMLGSVWEWTTDYRSDYPYNPSPVEDMQRKVVIRGGDWLTELKEMGVTIRAGIYPDKYADTVGFRCARS